MPSEIITLEDGFRILDINCNCGTHSQITHEDVFTYSCTCGKLYFNLAYYEFDRDGTVNFNEFYWKEKDRKLTTRRRRRRRRRRND